MAEDNSKLSGNDLMVLGISKSTDVKVFASFCGTIMATTERKCVKTITSYTGKDYCERKAQGLWTINKTGYTLLAPGKKRLASLLCDAKLKSIYEGAANEDKSGDRFSRSPAKATRPATPTLEQAADEVHTPRKRVRFEDSSPTVAELVDSIDEAIDEVDPETALMLWYSLEFANVKTPEQSMALSERYIVKKQRVAEECASRIADLQAARYELVTAEKTAISTLKQHKNPPPNQNK